MAEFGGIPALPPTQRDSGFAPRTVMWRVAGERLHSTQLRRSRPAFESPKQSFTKFGCRLQSAHEYRAGEMRPVRNQPFVQLAVPAGSDQYRKLANGHE